MQSALVTGASRGIGRGIAIDLAKRGFALTVTSRRKEHLDALTEELAQAGYTDVTAHVADLADTDGISKLVELHQRTYSSMDALVLSGGMGFAGAVESMPLGRVQTMLDVNFSSAYHLIQHALPLLRAAGRAPGKGARVIAIASVAGIYTQPGLAAYGASKAALISLLESVNAEESGHAVMATAIAPGYVATDMSAWLNDTIPAEEMISVDDVVAAVRMLLELGRSTSLTRLTMTRSGSRGYEA